MFVEQKRFWSNPRFYIFTNRKHLWVSIFESVASPIQDRFCSPKGAFAYKKLFDMQKEKNFVTDNTVSVTVTPAQKALLSLITPSSASTFLENLQSAMNRATYLCAFDLTQDELRGDFHLKSLEDVILKISQESNNSKQL